jgi:hypothetical protein
MGFLQKNLEEMARPKPGDSFVCARCDQASNDPSGAASGLCPGCTPIVASVSLYPARWIWGLAMATGPFTAGTLAALNWRRLGNTPKSHRIFLQLGGLLLAVLIIGPAAFMPPVFAGGFIVVAVWVSLVSIVIARATSPLSAIEAAHTAIGGAKANVVVPVMIASGLALPAAFIWFQMMRRRFGL